MANLVEKRSPGMTQAWQLWAAALALFAFEAAPARAGLIMQVQNSAASAGGTGSFDVTLADTGGTFNIAGFSVNLTVPGASGVSFTDVNTDTIVSPYIFGTLQTPPFSFDTFPNTQFIASDVAATSVTINPGDTFGLAHVTYSVTPGAPSAAVPVSLIDIGGGTALADENGNFVSFTTTDGTITVSGTAVPEPASLTLLGLGAASMAGYALRKNRSRVGL
jgi:hypothetical protein